MVMHANHVVNKITKTKTKTKKPHKTNTKGEEAR